MREMNTCEQRSPFIFVSCETKYKKWCKENDKRKEKKWEGWGGMGKGRKHETE